MDSRGVLTDREHDEVSEEPWVPRLTHRSAGALSKV